MVLALGVALKVRSLDVKRFVLLGTIVAGLSALAPYWTGESAEEVIEHWPGISKDLIHEHEELAEKATALSIVTAAAAGVAFFLERRRPQTLGRSLPVVFVLSLLTLGVMGATAHEGGKIRHPEINPSEQASRGEIP
ncbi:MAG: hypothetical protein H7318_15660 [Oligoflexus sp.]|nr:hypothetical protein [Oligoflexus sp.]